LPIDHTNFQCSVVRLAIAAMRRFAAFLSFAGSPLRIIRKISRIILRAAALTGIISAPLRVIQRCETAAFFLFCHMMQIDLFLPST
jgi:hypothetical protein